MKLITLNIWGGRVKKPLLEFISSHKDIDIFCIQELYHNATESFTQDDKERAFNIYAELKELLPDHQAFFRPVIFGKYGIGMFVKKGIEVLEEGEIALYENPNYPGYGGDHRRNLQWIRAKVNGKELAVVNVHGLWNGKGKSDSPDRIEQSRRIKAFIDTLTVPKILCGDFNLRPDTESLKMLEPGMVNLVKDYGVTSTRTSFYEKSEKFADYMFTSPEIQVKEFKVLPDEVSDHAALYLEVE